MCEEAGFPTSTLVCEGFLGLAANSSIGLGMPNLPVALVPGHTGVQSKEVLRRNILEVTVDRVIGNLIAAPATAAEVSEPAARDVIFRGGFDAVNRYFVANELSDGLPVVPPTREKVEQFLRFTDRGPDDVLGILLPDNRAATVWSVAVNAVMAGGRPEYMTVLIALGEAMAEPYYGVEHSGNTTGGETLIILNGPIIKELGFNYTQGVVRDGFIANTSVGRFWRLYLRNVAGFLPHKNDKATYGNTWRVVVAENEDVLREIGWEPNSVEWGYAAGDNTVTIARYTGGNLVSSVSGSTPEQMLPYLADGVIKQTSWQIMFTVGQGWARCVRSSCWSDSGPDDCGRRLVQAGSEAAAVRACAHAGVAIRALPSRLDHEAHLGPRAGSTARTHPESVLRIRRSQPHGSHRVGSR